MSADNVQPPVRASLTRVAVAGWAGWAILASTLLISTLAAALERRSGVCGSEGLGNPRMWVFHLIPLGQTCAGEPPNLEVILHIAMTTIATLGAVSGISAVLILLLRRSRTGLPAVARSLLWGVAVGVGLAVIAWAARAMRGIPYLEPTGVSLSMTLVVSVAFCVGLAGTALVSGVLAARRSSRS